MIHRLAWDSESASVMSISFVANCNPYESAFGSVSSSSSAVLSIVHCLFLSELDIVGRFGDAVYWRHDLGLPVVHDEAHLRCLKWYPHPPRQGASRGQCKVEPSQLRGN